jgi:ribosomal protein S12 methylthiotransferase
LVSAGVREIILIAQDTAAHPGLPVILEGLDEIAELRWVRLLYAHPANLEDVLLDRIAESGKVLNYLDMPVQHLADSVLGRMNRRVGFDKIEALAGKARLLDPGFSLRTTVIVGFPGETDDEFRILKDRLELLRFTNLVIFVYSPEPSTSAADMDGQILPDIKEKRLLELIRIAEKIREEEYVKLQGSVQDAVVDFVAEGRIIGRLSSDAPEIDRILEIEGDGLSPGEFGRVKITGGKDDRIFASWIESF